MSRQHGATGFLGWVCFMIVLGFFIVVAIDATSRLSSGAFGEIAGRIVDRLLDRDVPVVRERHRRSSTPASKGKTTPPKTAAPKSVPSKRAELPAPSPEKYSRALKDARPKSETKTGPKSHKKDPSQAASPAATPNPGRKATSKVEEPRRSRAQELHRLIDRVTR